MRTLNLTRGRVVDYHCGESDDLLNPGPDGLLSAFVSFVNPDGSVNVTVHAADGNTFVRSGVAFFNIGQTLPESGRYCLWPEAIIRMEEAAEKYKNELLDRGTTLEQANPGNTDSAATDATLDAAQKSDATAPVDTSPAAAEMSSTEAGALSS